MLSYKSILGQTKKPVFWAVVVALLYAAVTIYITIHLMYDSYHSSAFDLGVFAQELKNTLQGQILYSSAIGGSQFAPHFSPVLLLLVPVYWVFPHVQMLLVVQALLLAFGGYLVYVLACEYNCSHRASLVLETFYFINPLVWGVAMFDFHEVAFAIPALLVMFLGMKRKNWILFGIGFVIALATKEDAVVALGVFGFILMVSGYLQSKKISKISLIIFCSAILTYGISIAVSRLASGGEHTRLLSYFTTRYAYIGQPLSVGLPLAFHAVFSTDSLFLIIAYLAPLAFIPLLSPKWSIPALLILLSCIFSTWSGQHSSLTQYSAVAIPFLFVAFIEVLPKVLRNRQIKLLVIKTKNRAVLYFTVFLIIISVSIIHKTNIYMATSPDAHDANIDQVIALIPDNATVTASNKIFPHLVSRTDVYLDAQEGVELQQSAGIIRSDWGFPDKDTEYVVLDTGYTPVMAPDIKLLVKNYKLIKTIAGVKLYQLNP